MSFEYTKECENPIEDCKECFLYKKGCLRTSDPTKCQDKCPNCGTRCDQNNGHEGMHTHDPHMGQDKDCGRVFGVVW